MPTGPGAPASVARAIVRDALRFRRGEELVVASWNHTLLWGAACVAEARRLGGRAVLLLEDEEAFWQSLATAPRTRAWGGLSAAARAAVRGADALVYFPGPADRPRLHSLPAAQAAPFGGEDERWYRLCRAHHVRGARCLLGYASEAQGDRWGVPGAMWRSQLLRAITEEGTEAIPATAHRVAQRLRRGRVVRITSGNGTDLTLRLRGARPWVDDGRVDREDLRAGHPVATVPGGAVVVAVDEGSARGTVLANRPSFLHSGRVDGGQWDFERGRLREYWYTGGAEAFEAEFGRAPRGRELLGILAFGVNPKMAAGVPHAEDLEAGTVTLAIGGNTAYGGRNPCRFLSWLTVGEATVALDGQPLVDRGEIL